MAEVYAGPVTRARSQKSRSGEPNNLTPVSKSISGNNFQPLAEFRIIITEKDRKILAKEELAAQLRELTAQ